jgi:ABC-2 type transport system ATP-binding protein
VNITLSNAGKKYGRNWIFRNFSSSFRDSNNYVIIGPNGSGKSTLLKIISGGATLSEGEIEYSIRDKIVKPESIFSSVSIAAPWLDIPEEYTLDEIITFHLKFKPLVNQISVKDSLQIIGLEQTNEKHYKNFSSGMKQRVKLGLAILTDAPLLLLDEPATALDAKSIQWYKDMINEFAKDRTILVFSNNREEEFGYCNEKLFLTGAT